MTILLIDTPEPGVLAITLQEGSRVVERTDVPYQGPVDNLLLTTVDNLLKRNSIDQSALSDIVIGQGIDTNSSLARIVTSFAAAVRASRQAP